MHTDRQACTQAGRQANRHTSRSRDNYTGKQTDTQTDNKHTGARAADTVANPGVLLLRRNEIQSHANLKPSTHSEGHTPLCRRLCMCISTQAVAINGTFRRATTATETTPSASQDDSWTLEAFPAKKCTRKPHIAVECFSREGSIGKNPTVRESVFSPRKNFKFLEPTQPSGKWIFIDVGNVVRSKHNYNVSAKSVQIQ